MFRNEAGWIQAYQKKGALWIHDGNPKRPHALLTSGKHSNGFFNSRLVIEDGELLREAAVDLMEAYGKIGFIWGFWCVVGPQTGATLLAQLLSGQVAMTRRDECYWASPSKVQSGDQKSMVFTENEKKKLSGMDVLLCEDVLTTGGSVELTSKAVIDAGGNVAPFILVLVNRSGLNTVNGCEVIALIDHPMPMWAPEECPLCRQGSVAVRPKDNWELLNRSY